MCDHVEFLRYPMDDAFRILGKRWAAAVLMEVLKGTDRFNMLKAAVPNISPRTLSNRLDDLERVGLLRRRVMNGNPSRVHYILTEKGTDMKVLLREFAGFSLKWYRTNHSDQPGPLSTSSPYSSRSSPISP